MQEKLVPPAKQDRLDIRVTLVLRERLAQVEKPELRVQAVLRAKQALQELAGIPEHQEKQELRASLELLERLAQQGLLERLGLQVPQDSRVVVVRPVKPEQQEALAQLARLGQQDSQE